MLQDTKQIQDTSIMVLEMSRSVGREEDSTALLYDRSSLDEAQTHGEYSSQCLQIVLSVKIIRKAVLHRGGLTVISTKSKISTGYQTLFREILPSTSIESAPISSETKVLVISLDCQITSTVRRALRVYNEEHAIAAKVAKSGRKGKIQLIRFGNDEASIEVVRRELVFLWGRGEQPSLPCNKGSSVWNWGFVAGFIRETMLKKRF